MEYTDSNYCNLYALIVSYFKEFDFLEELQDKSSDINLPKEDIDAYQTRFTEYASEFHEKCYGKFISFPVITKTGKNYLQSKKVKDGVYELIMKYVENARSRVEAIINLNKEFRDNGYECSDEDLVPTTDEYKMLLQDKQWLIHKIEEYKKILKQINSEIRDYELVYKKEN